MTDPLTDLTPDETGTEYDAPSADFAASLRRRVEAIEARSDRSRAARWHLAQLNLGLFKHPLDHPDMAPFVAALDRINALAEASPGFVWRLTDEAGASSSFVDVPGADDPLWAPNLSVWTDLDSLRNFMYRSPVAIVINVDDCDAVYAHAVQAGATGERPPANQHGQRSGWFVDPWGHRWCPTSEVEAI